MAVALGGKTFVSASGPGMAENKKTKATLSPNFIAPAPAGVSAASQQEARLLAQQEVIQRMSAPRFVAPNGDEAWGRKIYQVGLGLEYCSTDKMTDGWLKAAEPEVNPRLS